MLQVLGRGRPQVDEFVEGVVPVGACAAVFVVVATLQRRQADLFGDEVQAGIECGDDAGVQLRCAGTLELDDAIGLPVAGLRYWYSKACTRAFAGWVGLATGRLLGGLTAWRCGVSGRETGADAAEARAA